MKNKALKYKHKPTDVKKKENTVTIYNTIYNIMFWSVTV
jgi:hypothetical protein